MSIQFKESWKTKEFLTYGGWGIINDNKYTERSELDWGITKAVSLYRKAFLTIIKRVLLINLQGFKISRF